MLAFWGAIILPSLPQCTFFWVVFCLATKNEKVTRLTTRLTFLLLPTLIKHTEEGEFDVFFLFRCNTFQVVSIFAFVAAQPLFLVNAIFVHVTIPNTLHFEAHLVRCLKRTNKALPLQCFQTLGMLIIIQMLCKFHSKEENIKRVMNRFR